MDLETIGLFGAPLTESASCFREGVYICQYAPSIVVGLLFLQNKKDQRNLLENSLTSFYRSSTKRTRRTGS